MRKLQRKLSKKDKARGVIFTSTLSKYKFKTPDTTTHEVLKTDTDQDKTIDRLLDDSFFNNSHFKYNIIES